MGVGAAQDGLTRVVGREDDLAARAQIQGVLDGLRNSDLTIDGASYGNPRTRTRVREAEAIAARQCADPNCPGNSVRLQRQKSAANLH